MDPMGISSIRLKTLIFLIITCNPDLHAAATKGGAEDFRKQNWPHWRQKSGTLTVVFFLKFLHRCHFTAHGGSSRSFPACQGHSIYQGSRVQRSYGGSASGRLWIRSLIVLALHSPPVGTTRTWSSRHIQIQIRRHWTKCLVNRTPTGHSVQYIRVLLYSIKHSPKHVL